MGENKEQTVGSAEVVLPDFRNVGVLMRTALLAEWARLLVGFFLGRGTKLDEVAAVFQQGVVFEPALLSTLLILIALGPWLRSLSYQIGCIVVGCTAVLIAIAWSFLYAAYIEERLSALEAMRVIMGGASLSVIILVYFNWRYRVLSPAWSEARLMALQARIRPHFLFNSLNTVLGLMRVEPRRAETVLESLAELFRVLMSDASVLVSLDRELALARAYAEVEAVRLEGRLTVVWQCQSAPMDARVPPLILQPLLENAVYHGIEPVAEGGAVTVTVFAKDGQLNMVVRNPYHAGQAVHSGNRMALENIRERLELHFDEEAHMKIYQSGDEFIVQIRIPYKHG